MASLLKDIYSTSFYNRLATVLEKVLPAFNKKKFISKVFTSDFESKELKERMRHTSMVLHEFMPASFSESSELIKDIIGKLREQGTGEDSLAYMFLPDYVEVYGIDDYSTAVRALEFVTQFVSCEFAVRPFLLKFGDRMIKQMLAWSKHSSYKVRRLASEGSRPRLPWAMAVPALKKDPAPILPILENLKNDPSEWVRRSVANSLNDIAKDHPGIVLHLAKEWAGTSKETDAIIKHGSRTLLKQGHTEILKHYGLDSENISISHFRIHTPAIRVGESLEFSFTITNAKDTSSIVRLEYAVFYRKQNGQPSKKVFKISEKTYPPRSKAIVHRKQKFVLITTRTFYAGAHRLSVIINGEQKAVKDFELML